MHAQAAGAPLSLQTPPAGHLAGQMRCPPGAFPGAGVSSAGRPLPPAGKGGKEPALKSEAGVLPVHA